jgi:hypothetical protein
LGERFQPLLVEFVGKTPSIADHSVVRPMLALKGWNEMTPEGIAPFAAYVLMPLDADDSRTRPARIPSAGR